MADFNCDPNKGTFYADLTNLTNSHDYIVSDVDRLPPDSNTYLSANGSAGSSWIYHVVVSRINLAINHKIIYGCTLYDHFPLYFEAVMNIQVDTLYVEKPSAEMTNMRPINWEKFTAPTELKWMSFTSS